MNQQRVFLVQTLLEALIPVVGYFAWNWDLTFILLFYLLDALLALGILIAKGTKRLAYSQSMEEQQLLLKRVAITHVFFGAAVAMIAFGVTQLQPGTDWVQRIHAFLTYKEMGIEQGYVLIPLIVLNGILVFRQQFLVPARYRSQDMQTITTGYLRQGMVLLAAGGVFGLMVSWVNVPEATVVAAFISGISAYRFFLIRRH